MRPSAAEHSISSSKRHGRVYQLSGSSSTFSEGTKKKGQDFLRLDMSHCRQSDTRSSAKNEAAAKFFSVSSSVNKTHTGSNPTGENVQSGRQKTIRPPKPTSLKQQVRSSRQEIYDESDPSSSFRHLSSLFTALYKDNGSAALHDWNVWNIRPHLNTLFNVAGLFCRKASAGGSRNPEASQHLLRHPEASWSLFPPSELASYLHKNATEMDKRLTNPIGSPEVPRIRNYVDNAISQELDEAVTQLLKKLQSYQQKLKTHQPLRTKARQRYVVGLKQALKGLDRNRVKLCILAPDLEPVRGESVLDKLCRKVAETCAAQAVDYVYALSTSRLRAVLSMPAKSVASCVAIYSAEGAYEEMKKIQQLITPLRQQACKIGSRTDISVSEC